MSAVGSIRTALDHYTAAHRALVWGEVYSLAQKPLNREELLVAVDALRRAQLAILDALAADNVVRIDTAPGFRMASGQALSGLEHVGRLFAPDALAGVPTINNPKEA